MFELTITIASVASITAAITVAAHVLPSRNINLEKSSPYECGFDPLNSARIPFSFRFFLVAILFLLFDLEIALIFPLPFSLILSNPLLSITLATLFLFILLMGLVYEWVNGGLDWAE